MPYLELNGEVANVKMEAVQKYLRRGAKIVGPPEPGLQRPVVDPIDAMTIGPGVVKGGIALGDLGVRGIQAGARALAPALSRAAEAASGPLARAGAKFAARRVPFLDLALDARDFVKAAQAARGAGAAGQAAVRGAGQAGAEAAGATEGSAAQPIAESALARIRAMGQMRANASQAARTKRTIDLEEALAQSRLDAAAKREIRKALGGNVERSTARTVARAEPKPVAAPKPEVTAPKPAPKVEPKTVSVPRSKPEMRVVKGNKPSQEELAKLPEAWRPANSRHNVQYYSETQKKFIDIENMHIAHLRSAFNKLGRRLAKTKRPAPVTREVFEAMKKEIAHRASQAGGLTAY